MASTGTKGGNLFWDAGRRDHGRRGAVQGDELGQTMPSSSHSFYQGTEPLQWVDLIKNKWPGSSVLPRSCSFSAHGHRLWDVACKLCMRSWKHQRKTRLELSTGRNSRKYSRPQIGSIKTLARRSLVTLPWPVTDTSLTLQGNEKKSLISPAGVRPGRDLLKSSGFNQKPPERYAFLLYSGKRARRGKCRSLLFYRKEPSEQLSPSTTISGRL